MFHRPSVAGSIKTLCLAATFLALSAPLVSFGQDEPAPREAAQPFAVVNVAGVTRWRENIQYVFQAIERNEVTEFADAYITAMKDLKGLDRERPFGLMVYLNGLTPSMVAYVPASNVADLAETMSMGPITAKKVEGKDDRYELVGGRQTFHVAFRGDYGFIANDAEAIEREFPNPATLVKSLSARYDLAASLNMEQIPEPTRKIFLGFLQAGAQSQLQQRDNEPIAEYRIRKANGMSNLQVMEQVLQHGRSFTLGWDVEPAAKRAVMEMTLELRPDSEFARYLQKVGSKPSHFRGLLKDGAPMAMSISWQMDKARRDSLVEVLKAGREAVAPSDPQEKEKHPIEQQAMRDAGGRLFDQLIATGASGHVDACLQITETMSGKFVLAGGLKLDDADAAARPLGDLVGAIPEKDSPFGESVRNADSHRGVELHRLTPKNIGRQNRTIYGEKPSIWLGAGSKALWFAFGGDDAAPAMKQLLDQAAELNRNAPPDATSDPFRMVVNVERWMSLTPAEADRPRRPPELMKEAFVKGKDALRIDVRPTENGIRMRLEFDEGFLRLIGLGLARQYDRSQL